MIDLTKIELKEGNVPKEFGYYVCREGETTAIVLITHHETDRVLVILQCGTSRVFSLEDTYKNYLWSDRLKLPKSISLVTKLEENTEKLITKY